MRSNNDDDLDEAIFLAKQGQMNPKTFKNSMPKEAARFLGNFDRDVSAAFFMKIQSTIMSELELPYLMNEKLAFRLQGDETQYVEVRAIISYASVLTGFDNAGPFISSVPS
jgi:hypothetical protein